MSRLSDDSMKHLRSVIDLPDLSETHYKLGEKIAAGGMATIYKAEDTRLKRRVAIKVLSSTNYSGEFIARMEREAHTIAQLEHPGIVPIYDLGTLPDGRVYYVMKYVEGKTLEEFVGSEITLSERLRILQKVVEAISFAHSRGVVHRDLKPANIMIGSFGEVLVMDWGISTLLEGDGSVADSPAGKLVDFIMKHVDQEESRKTDTAPGTVVGTPAYMSPEQARGETGRIDERTDVYALGALLYFLLANQAPFHGRDAKTVFDRVSNGRVIPPRRANKAIAKQIQAVCLKAMSLGPEDRYQQVSEFGSDIARYLDGQSVAAYKEDFFERSGRWVARNQFIVILIVAYIVVRFLILIILGH